MAMNCPTRQDPRYKQPRRSFLCRVVRCLEMERGVALVKPILIYIKRSQQLALGPPRKDTGYVGGTYISQLGTPWGPH